MKKVYLDYAATSPTKPEVVKAMLPYFSRVFGNPSSIHSFGRQAKEAVSKVRLQIAKFLNCSASEVIFTSGGTESDNLAIRGIVNAYRISPIAYSKSHIAYSSNKNHKRYAISDKQNHKQYATHSTDSGQVSNKPHLITSAFEHHAVLDTCKDLEKRGLAEVTYIKPDREGIVSVKSIKKAIKTNTVLVSIMYVNNEIGTVQPIAEISKAIRRWTLDSSQKSTSDYCLKSKVYFHTDAVQAIEYQPCDVRKLGVDMLSISAHKFGGPKGVGVLYIKKGTPIHHQNTGGGQEFRLRAGTENVPGIVGLGKAIEHIAYRISHIAKNNKPYAISNMQKLRNYFIDETIRKIPNVRLNGSRRYRNPNNVNLAFKYVEGESILIHLDLAGIAASSGSACTSGSLEPSHVLKSIGLSDFDAHGSIRFTLGEATTKEEIDYVLKVLPPIIEKLRAISPFTK